jgi:hypothetical protein
MRRASFKCKTPRLKLKSSRRFLAIKRWEGTKIGKVIKQSRSSKLRWAHIWAHSRIHGTPKDVLQAVEEDDWKENSEDIATTVIVGGPVQVFSPIYIYFWAGDLIFRRAKTPQKTDRRRTKRGQFFDTMRITPSHHHDFTIDLQQCWSINRKIGNRQCTYYLIVHALTVTDCCFFVAATIRPQ